MLIYQNSNYHVEIDKRGVRVLSNQGNKFHNITKDDKIDVVEYQDYVKVIINGHNFVEVNNYRKIRE
ncbi:MAG: hypothetical protein R2685_10530 [Candidatus Nitrosocosmicus sp.]|nr:hypothetical protein [Candidatus Nitrosocosmicus sp.]